MQMKHHTSGRIPRQAVCLRGVSEVSQRCLRGVSKYQTLHAHPSEYTMHALTKQASGCSSGCRFCFVKGTEAKLSSKDPY